MSSLSILLDDAFGWRGAVRFIAGFCILLAMTQFLVPEPVRNATNMLKEDDRGTAIQGSYDQAVDGPLMKD